MEVKREIPKRSQSLCSLQSEGNSVDLKYVRPFVRTYSDSSVEVCLQDEEFKQDSGICDRMLDGDMLVVLEQKIDRLSEMFLEQCRLLTTMKEEIRSSKLMIEKTEHAHNQILVDMLKQAIAQRVESIDTSAPCNDGQDTTNSRAKSLLSAIESKKISIDSEIRASLINFLQSEELKDQMVRATAESVRGLIGGCLSRDMSKLYLPVLERSHRRLIAHIHRVIEAAFVELEDKSSSLHKSVYKTSGALRRALERHQCLLEATSNPGKNVVTTLQCTVEELLHKELKEWRQKVTDMFTTQFQTDALTDADTSMPPLDYAPITPPQPAGPDTSVIDQLMKTAIINKQIREGDVNGSFEQALSASDLSLVMAACRAADPGDVFAPPCSLEQHVLMSLVQQLATDMLHETPLKCRYLEEAIINLNMANPETRAHLPLVVGEVRKHLSKFLNSYPNHAANKRIMLIIMAVNNLLN